VRWVGSNQVISASTDNTLKLWDVADAAQSEGNCAPITSFTGECCLILQHQLRTSVLATAALLCLSCVCYFGYQICWSMVCVGTLLGYICKGWCLLCVLLVCNPAAGAHQQPMALQRIELQLNLPSIMWTSSMWAQNLGVHVHCIGIKKRSRLYILHMLFIM